MRFGISATSLMCPKNLRTRLRPVNVCCAIVASHFVALKGRAFRSATAAAPGLNFDSLRNPKLPHQELNPESKPWTFKTQNDARGATAPARPNRFCHGLKKPEIACLPTAYAGTSPLPPSTVFSCCRPAMGRRSWRFEGEAPESPHIPVYT